jgi:hypothetical protein
MGAGTVVDQVLIMAAGGLAAFLAVLAFVSVWRGWRAAAAEKHTDVKSGGI